MDIVKEDKSTHYSHGQILHQCLPISYLKLLDDYLLIVAEGPCLLLTHPKLSSSSPNNKTIKRFQIFPNQLTITGVCPVENSVQQNKDHSLLFIWAGNNGIFIPIHKPTCEISDNYTYPSNRLDLIAFEYIPIAARWLNKYDEDGKTLAVLSVFNYVTIYERSLGDGSHNLKEIAKYEGERENLYSGGMIGDRIDQLIVFSGTTFKGILVWSLDLERKAAIVHHKLMGHQGIPFSLEFDKETNMLLSSSDDRTVMVWKFNDDNLDSMDIDESQSSSTEIERTFVAVPLSTVKVAHTLRRHEARVWKAIWVKRGGQLYIVSVGEDSCVSVTSFDRSIEKSWKCHEGASVYHCAYDQFNDLLYTGGHDGSINKWKRFYLKTDSTHIPYDKICTHPWVSDLVKVNEYGRSVVNTDYPRNICLWDVNFIVILMDSGRLIAYNYPQEKQFEIFFDECFVRYGVLSVSRQRTLMAIGGLKGDLILLHTYTEEIQNCNTKCLYADKVWKHNFNSKLVNLVWLSDDATNKILIVCLEKAFLFRFISVSESSQIEIAAEYLQTFTVHSIRPGLPSGILTGGLESSKYLVAGDEDGTLHVYQTDKPDSENYILTRNNIHKEGITCIVEYNSRIMTAGRYGGVKSFKLNDNEAGTELIQIHEYHPPFEWVGMMKEINTDLLIGGFHKSSYIIFSWKDKRVLHEVVNLGGGHRRWDFSICNGNAALVYIREREIFYSSISISDRADSVLKSGLHCKTINCGLLLQKRNKNLYYATGGEDGSIRVFRYDVECQSYHSIHRIDSHASSVRTLTSLNIDGEEDHILLFSGGGRSQIYVFQIGINNDELSNMGTITVIKAKNRNSEIDTRIMDLSVIRISSNCIFCICACSDGLARILSYCINSKKFTIIAILQGNKHSIMRILSIKSQKTESVHILGATSNGYLLSWNYRYSLITEENSFNNTQNIPLHDSIQLSKAAIMSMSLNPLNVAVDDEFTLAIGSDNCSISVWKLLIQHDPSLKINCSLLWENVQNQRGALVGINFTHDQNNVIFTCSNDQVLGKWDANSGKLLGTIFTGVTDCQGLVVSDGIENECIMCFGDGITWLSSP